MAISYSKINTNTWNSEIIPPAGYFEITNISEGYAICYISTYIRIPMPTQTSFINAIEYINNCIVDGSKI